MFTVSIKRKDLEDVPDVASTMYVVAHVTTMCYDIMLAEAKFYSSFFTLISGI